MPEISYGVSAYKRDEGNLPELPLVNMFVEQTKSDETVLQSRTGMVTHSTAGTGAVDGVFTADGVFGGALFAVGSSDLYRDGVSVGTIGGTGVVSFAATGDDDDFDDQLAVVRAAGLWHYTNTGLNAVNFPASASVIKVAYLAGLFIALKPNSQRFYWSAVGNGASWNGLDFASAEKEPDALIDIVVLNDMLILIGRETVEFWQVTGDSDLPFSPITGRVFNKGGRQTGCAVNYDNTAAWIGANNIVYIFDGDMIPTAISDDGIVERIEASTTARAFSFFLDRHEFLAVALDQGTWLFDASTGQWCEFNSYGKTNWLAQCASGGFFGSRESGGVLQFGTAHTDLGGVLERRFRAGFPINGGSVRMNNVRLRVNSGQTPNLTGDYDDPLVEISVSRDAGQTFGTPRTTKLGAQGKYRQRVEFRNLGLADEPGFLADFRCTDPVPFRVSDVSVNELYGGRSR